MKPATVDVLTRHFVSAIFRPAVLTELGSDYLRQTIAGLLAIVLVMGIFLTRAFFDRYTELNAMVSREPYYRAVQADSLMMIALPMLVVGLVAVVLCPLLFPDETDYRNLTPLPVTRLELFGAKFLAVAIVMIVVVLSVVAISSFWFPVATGGRRALHPAAARIAAHAVATIAGSLWMFSAVMAVQGASLAVLPARWQRRGGLILQALLLVALLLSIPLITRMPALLVTQDVIMTSPLVWIPASWFLGIERTLLSGAEAGGYVDAARVAAVAGAATVGAILATYLRLFVSAERLAGFSGADRTRRGAGAGWLSRLPPPTAATVSFVWSGLTRSRLHQFVLLIVVAGGAALLIGQIADVITGATPFARRPGSAVRAAIGAPLTVALSMLLGLRAAMLLPLDRASAWIFQITESPRTRRDALDGVVYVCLAAGLVLPLIVAAVLQPAVLGSAWWACAALTGLEILVMIEVILANWQRLPFACTYLPGKHNVAYTLGVLLGCFFVVVVIGGNLIRWAIAEPFRTLALGVAFVAAFAWLRRSRLEIWGNLPLEFEDYNPAEVRKLGFVPD